MKRAPSNLRVMLVRSSVASFVTNVNPYTSLYVVALGATGTQLGLLNSVTMAVSMVFALLTGWVSDRSNRKLVYLAGAFIGILVPIVYGFAWNLTWLTSAFILAGLSEGVLQPSWVAMYSNSINNRQRGTIYGIVNFFVLAPILFASIIGGAIVSVSGGLTATGIRPIYWLQFALLASIWVLVFRFLIPEQKPTRRVPLSLRTMFGDYREVLRVEGVRSWVLMKSLGSISIGLAGPFWMLYAVVVHKASAMTIAYMVTAKTAIQIVASPLSGRLIDAVGRKKMIITGRAIMYVASVIFLFGRGDVILILAWIMMGLNDATGIAWSAKEAELVKEGQRSRMTAMSQGAFNALAIPASILGGFLWDNVNWIAPFVVMILIDGLIRMPIIHFLVPESNGVSSETDDESNRGFALD